MIATRLTRRAFGHASIVALAATALAGGAALMAPGVAFAHERRAVGPYTFIVGFIGEPAITGEPNGIDLRISKTDDGSPVEGADKTLKATIAQGGGAPKEFPLRALFGKPGSYTADLIPTKAGSYIFTFSGTINGTAVNERFESGPGRFNDVQAADALQFPDTVGSAAGLSSSVKSANDQANDASARAAAAEAKVGQAQMLGAGGLVLGLIGSGLGLAGFMASRRASAPVVASAGAEGAAVSRTSPAGAR